jgi:hypothetical protein
LRSPETNGSLMRRLSHLTIRQVELTWLALIALSFGIGGLAILIIPSASEGIYSVGESLNVVMAVAMGILIGWTRNWSRLGSAVFSGSVVTVVGVNLVDLALPGASFNGAWELFFATIAICVAIAGTAILLGGAAVVTMVLRGIARGIGSRLGCDVVSRVAL